MLVYVRPSNEALLRARVLRAQRAFMSCFTPDSPAQMLWAAYRYIF